MRPSIAAAATGGLDEETGMRRWNGWGDTAHDEALHAAAKDFLQARLGPGQPRPDASREAALAALPEMAAAGLPAGFSSDAALRLDHARGQSFPDWVAMRAGAFSPAPQAVAMPSTHDEVTACVDAARRAGAVLVPYGGGTSVVGHLLAESGDDRPVWSLSLERLNALSQVDEVAWTARLGAGAAGPQVEAALREHGFVLGHYPQSFEYSTVGGWVVTRSSGQQSLRYGRIEQLFHGGRLATPTGEWRVGGVPATGAGVDPRDLVLGSEGRLGVLTEVDVRVRPIPEQEGFHAVFFPDWESAFDAIRSLAQSGIGLSMLRLSNAVETDTQLRLAGDKPAIAMLRRYLRLRGIGEGSCMLMIGITGTRAECKRLRSDAGALVRRWRGIWIGELVGRNWQKKRFTGPYMRNSLWDAGYAVDTVETAVDWPHATATMYAIEAAAREALGGFDLPVHAFTHLSHVYRQGCSIYSTFVWPMGPSPDADLEHWRTLKHVVSQTIVDHGGTISHQHGVGVDHARYAEVEKGVQGMAALRAMAAAVDPEGMMNPGKLFA